VFVAVFVLNLQKQTSALGRGGIALQLVGYFIDWEIAGFVLLLGVVLLFLYQRRKLKQKNKR
jgi:hypothetical protein